jgi:hypothetical protein
MTTDHRCPFCRQVVHHVNQRRLVHAPPECAEFRRWLDAAPPLVPRDREATLEAVEAWQGLIDEVQRVGLANAPQQQRELWAKQLDELGAPYLANAIRGTTKPQDDADPGSDEPTH